MVLVFPKTQQLPVPSTQLFQSSGIVTSRRIGYPAGDEHRDSGQVTRVSLVTWNTESPNG